MLQVSQAMYAGCRSSATAVSPSSCRVDRAAQPGAPHDTRAARGRRTRSPGSCAAAASACTVKRCVRRERHEVGVCSDGDAALLVQADEVGRAARHPAAARVRAGCRGSRASVHTAAEARAAAPRCRPTRPGSRRHRANLSSTVAGEWSVTTMSMSPSSEGLPRAASRFASSRIGGQHLNWVAPSGICSSAIVEVVRAGLDGDRQPLRPRRPQRRQARQRSRGAGCARGHPCAAPPR